MRVVRNSTCVVFTLVDYQFMKSSVISTFPQYLELNKRLGTADEWDLIMLCWEHHPDWQLSTGGGGGEVIFNFWRGQSTKNLKFYVTYTQCWAGNEWLFIFKKEKKKADFYQRGKSWNLNCPSVWVMTFLTQFTTKLPLDVEKLENRRKNFKNFSFTHF